MPLRFPASCFVDTRPKLGILPGPEGQPAAKDWFLGSRGCFGVAVRYRRLGVTQFCVNGSLAARAGDDLRVDLELDFKTACFGGEEKVRRGPSPWSSPSVVVALVPSTGWRKVSRAVVGSTLGAERGVDQGDAVGDTRLKKTRAAQIGAVVLSARRESLGRSPLAASGLPSSWIDELCLWIHRVAACTSPPTSSMPCRTGHAKRERESTCQLPACRQGPGDLDPASRSRPALAK